MVFHSCIIGFVLEKGQSMKTIMKMKWNIVSYIGLVMIIVLGARQTLIQKAAAAQQYNPDTRSLAALAFRNGIDYYPNAGKIIKGGKSYPYSTFKAGTPMFQIDPAWPKFPEQNLLLGEAPAVAVDAQDNIWILTRPKRLLGRELFADMRPPQADCCIPAPPVIEFDAAGNFIQGWGGPGKEFEWPEEEHGIYVDYKGNVWISGNGPKDNHILKFTRDGKFLLQIGHSGKSQGSLDTANLNKATDISVYPKTNEVFVADGYGNKRVIVFDADTGAYKRMWGAYGNNPDDSVGPSYMEPRAGDEEGPGAKQFNVVHCVRISNDGLVYVCDRTHDRVQVFRIDGTYVNEVFVARQSTGAGVTDAVAFSSDSEQKFMYVVDSPDQHIWILDRKTFQVLGRFGRTGHYAGQTYRMHDIAADSKGNIYIAEGVLGQRVDKFVFKGLSSAASQ
jgi:DNA-binding beta-propeller fold protein YncE